MLCLIAQACFVLSGTKFKLMSNVMSGGCTKQTNRRTGVLAGCQPEGKCALVLIKTLCLTSSCLSMRRTPVLWPLLASHAGSFLFTTGVH